MDQAAIMRFSFTCVYECVYSTGEQIKWICCAIEMYRCMCKLGMSMAESVSENVL